MVIRAVLFDCFGVLVLPGFSPLFDMYPDKKQEIQGLIDEMDLGTVTMPQYYEASGRVVGMSSEKVERIYHDDYRRNENAITWVKQLKQSGEFKIVLVTNAGIGRIDEVFDQTELSEMFDKVVISSEIGLKKPDSKFFNYTVGELRLEPEDCLLLDDQMKNIDAAKLAGMKAVQFESIEQASAQLSWMLEADNA